MVLPTPGKVNSLSQGQPLTFSLQCQFSDRPALSEPCLGRCALSKYSYSSSCNWCSEFYNQTGSCPSASGATERWPLVSCNFNIYWFSLFPSSLLSRLALVPQLGTEQAYCMQFSRESMHPFLTLDILSVPGHLSIIRRKCLSTQYEVARTSYHLYASHVVQVSVCNLHPSLFCSDGILTFAKSDKHDKTSWNH